MFSRNKIKYLKKVSQFINLSKYKYLHNFDRHGLLLLYDKNVICSSKRRNYHSGSEFIAVMLNEGHRKAIHVIMLYWSHVTLILSCINILEQLLCKIPLACPIVILDDFNMDFDKIDKYKDIQIFHACMSKYHFKQHLSIFTTKSNSLINHIWSNKKCFWRHWCTLAKLS